MNNQILASKKDLHRKKKAKHSADLHIALQLYAFYKAETVIKREPRIPRDDPRRGEPPLKHSVSLLQYLKLLIVNKSAMGAPGNELHRAIPSLSAN